MNNFIWSIFNKFLLCVGHWVYEDKRQKKYSLCLECGKQGNGNSENMKGEQCWPRSVYKVLRHEGKSPERKSCMRTESRKTEKVLTRQQGGEKGTYRGAACAKHWSLEQLGLPEEGVWKIMLEGIQSLCQMARRFKSNGPRRSLKLAVRNRQLTVEGLYEELPAQLYFIEKWL